MGNLRPKSVGGNRKPTVTIVVDQPIPDSRRCVDFSRVGADPVGHTFIRLNLGNGKVIYSGFYPAEALSTKQIALKQNVKGVILHEEDEEHKWNIAKVYQINKEQAEKIKKYVENYNKPYNMVLNNCTTFAVGALDVAGIKHPIIERAWTLPQNTQSQVKNNLPAILPAKDAITKKLISGLKGYTPADAAEDIANAKHVNFLENIAENVMEILNP